MSDRRRRDDAAIARFVEWFALSLAETGFPRMPARVFAGLLVADEGRRTAGELADALQVSPGAISGAVRYLGELGLVVREREPGDRRDYYRLGEGMWYEVLTRENDLFARWATGLRDGVDALGADTPAGARLDDSRRFFTFLSSEYPDLIRRCEQQRAGANHTS